MKTIILINGKKRHGKDYTAEKIAESLAVDVISFAEPMKTIVSETFGILPEELELYKNKPTEYKIQVATSEGVIQETDFREVLQRFGTEAMKPIFGNDVWVQAAIRKIEASDKDIIVIPDFRFGIELVGLYGYDVYTVSVVNRDIPSTDLHPSEKEIDDLGIEFDVVLDNTGKPSDFGFTVQNRIDEMLILEPLYDLKKTQELKKRL